MTCVESMAHNRRVLARGEESEECEVEMTRVVEWWPLFDLEPHEAGRLEDV